MKVLLTGNAHLYKTPDGKYYAPTIYGYEFFQRYLMVFDEVRFLAKTRYVDSIDTDNYLLTSGEGLEIFELPWYQGLKAMLKLMDKLILRYRKACDGCDCYIFRIAQIESYLTFILGKKRGKPFAVEVVNEPATLTDVKGVFKWINVQMQKYMTKKANGASYVTQYILQQAYPSRARIMGESNQYFETHYSSIDLISSYIRKPKKYTDTKTKFEVIHVANLINSNIKGHITLIESLKIVADHGYNITACFIGDGNFIPVLIDYAEKLGVADKLHFIGRLHNKEEIIERLSESDLFVYPTYFEGLSRSLIEAMAAGLPCISTPICGIPELLDEKYMFRPDDSESFAKEVMHLIENPAELEMMSQRNVEIADRFTKDKLTERRYKFYSKLRRLSEKKYQAESNNNPTQ